MPGPTIVLVHGAFADSSSWNGAIPHLRRADLSVVAVANPLRSLSGDASYVRDVLATIEGPIVLVGHSHGGSVITEAASRNPEVVALVYVAAFAPMTGESALTLSGSYPGSTLGGTLTNYPTSADGPELTIRQDLFPQQFAADVEPGLAALMAVAQRPVAESALTEGLPTDIPAWQHAPSWFVLAGDDRNIPAEAIRFMASRAEANDVREIRGASHAVAVSHPQHVAESILAAAGWAQ
ncbi:alpha/beta fold hydrolase [Occultella gossypii]|uniref:Alpha/beta hydrolase n=1 Tax=Occultella gossypii TaxID=2800820 RepID=A0ABS7S9Q8_9MICO|nr:alpha/beta hydrolase [Occultella gossypii]MBZ2196031.1 alpha/beta hydrolase [Occultella gossypii]